MPTVDSYYGKKAAAGTLKPEEGWTYETGIKKIYDNKSIKLAVFHMDFENKIGWSDKDPAVPVNSTPSTKATLETLKATLETLVSKQNLPIM